MQRHRPGGSPRVPVSRALRDRALTRAEVLAREGVIDRLWARDHTLWRPDPTEIADRLGWLDLDREMAAQVEDLHAFAGEVAGEGFSTALVLGMGGSSLATRVLATAFAGHTRGLDLVVLDSTVPGAVQAAEERAPAGRTLYVVSSKSGTTLETAALLDHFWAREPEGRRFVAITDAGSPLDILARERDFRRRFCGRTDVGGRFSALAHTGLVPAALLGVDLDRLLEGARDMTAACRQSASPLTNPGAQLGILVAEAATLDRDALTLRVDETLGAFDAWLEQLVAESTGKDAGGILPVRDEPLGPPEVYDDSRFFFAIGDAREARALEPLTDGGRLPLASYAPGDAYRLGAEFFRWEFATAVAGHVLGLNPFDQPDVEATKRETARLLRDGEDASADQPARDLVARLAGAGEDRPDYVSVHAYLPRTHANDLRLRHVRARLRNRFHVPTTVEYGPSLLHSTGQYHKGGRRRGAFLQITEAQAAAAPRIPGRDYSFEELVRAQADGDRRALRARDREVARTTLEELEEIAAEG